MSESLHLTIVYEDAGESWVMAAIPQVPGTRSQGPTRAQARANVIDALRLMLAGDDEERSAVAQPISSEPLELVIRLSPATNFQRPSAMGAVEPRLIHLTAAPPACPQGVARAL